MAYTDIDDPTAYFQTKIYTGDGNDNRSITFDGNSNLAVNFLWFKNRGATAWHNLYDSVRGANKALASNATNAEESRSDTLDSFNSNGFTVGNDTSQNPDGLNTNANGNTYVTWGWKAGTSFTNDASATGIGTIDSTGSVNTDAGFSIVSYTGNQTSGATVAHGLGSKPAMMIFKERNGTTGWVVYHHKNTSAPATEYLQLNSSNATGDYAGYFNDTEPTSSVFTLGNDTGINQSGDTYIAYCFAEKKGYSKFGSYTGNGSASSGTFIYTGFKPAFVMIKRTDTTGSWEMFDAKREGFNPQVHGLYANGSNAEDNTDDLLDLLSNGFKLYHDGGGLNASNGTYIYMAFAENPFVTSTGVPATAR